MTPSLGIEPAPHWWEASPLTTAPSLLPTPPPHSPCSCSNHNKAVINKSSNSRVPTINTCNCRDKGSCPMDGKCNERNVIYQAEVTTSHSRETYIGLCDTSFKSRYRNHTCSFRNERYRNSTELSKYVWSLKDKKVDYQIKWRIIVRHARSYSNVRRSVICVFGNSTI